jgi:uncharacterized protein YjiK
MLAIEKDDPLLIELNQDFQMISQYPVAGIADISSICYFNGMLYVLGDEDHDLFVLDPISYEIKRKFSFKILNPEGVSFNAEGNLFVVSDDMQRVFKFNQLP